ncbi:hypothetical protein JRO89_XS02G0162200 [Xanthoceras sorbifolium]|uniref:RNase H type-1 domain-containing protein n=1 Tax=Xanthoceras sorbifolium TaxID=99658 RepID=A0ABQ8IGP0_9ROSI|nr:hypothetical protein JRO89_XS02G0162200 [Xanthoceras sorbifolium]
MSFEAPNLKAPLSLDHEDWIIEFRSATDSGNSSVSDSARAPSAPRSVIPVRWSRPTSGGFKINSDAALNSSSKLVGLGAVIRDSNGNVMAACAKRLHLLCSAAHAEALALLCGVQLAINAGLTPTISEVAHVSRSANMVADGLAKYGLISSDDRFWIDSFPSCVIGAVSQELCFVTFVAVPQLCWVL